MDINTSLELCTESRLSIKQHSAKLGELETDAAVKHIKHCQEHGSAEIILKLAETLSDYGTKNGAKAFRYLAFNYTGAKKDGTIDKDRQNSSKETYLQELEAVKELGLVEWYETKAGIKQPKTEAEKELAKAKRAEKQAFNWLAKQDPDLAALVAEYQKLSKTNPMQAKDMVLSMLGKFKSSVVAALHKAVA